MRLEQGRSRRQAGFSLIELMVSMVVTLVVSGAMYGLIASGSNAFRREPELSDRQQNIRVAMNLIQNDLRAAGGGGVLPDLFLIFSPALNGTGPMGSGGAATDYLEFWANDGQCPDIAITGANGVNLTTLMTVPPCVPEPSFMIVFSPTSAKWGVMHNVHGNDDTKMNFPGGQQAPGSQINGPADLGTPVPTGAISVQRVRYAIANDTDATPALWRSASGGVDTSGVFQIAPTASGGWVLVARGIEDLQLRYRTAAGWVDAPPAAIASHNDIVREVRVTLSSRALAPNLQGTTSSSVGSAIRGQLTTVTTPRTALMALRNSSPKQWR